MRACSRITSAYGGEPVRGMFVTRWLIKHWVVPLALAVGVFVVIWGVSLPGFKAGQRLTQGFLEARINGQPLEWQSVFPLPLESMGIDTLEVYKALEDTTGYTFVEFEQRETGSMTYGYEVQTSEGQVFVVQFTLVSTDAGWRIGRLRRGGG